MSWWTGQTSEDGLKQRQEQTNLLRAFKARGGDSSFSKRLRLLVGAMKFSDVSGGDLSMSWNGLDAGKGVLMLQQV